jgi:aspartyl-tRNA(Asn)/glutamyl-tRNA(Gln) amidotransferase subunit B
MPELPAARAERLGRDWELTLESARLLAFRDELGDYFERAVATSSHPQQLANWIATELVSRIGERDPAQTPVEPAALAALVELVAARTVTHNAAKEVLDVLVERGGDPQAVIAERDLGVIAGDGALSALVAAAIAANPDAAASYGSGNEKAIGPIIGHVMRETRGRADATDIERLVREQLGL